MLERLTSAIAANRFGLGSRPGELDAIGGNGRDWLRAQLKDAPPRLTDAGLQTSSDILVETLDLRREIRASRQNDASVDAVYRAGNLNGGMFSEAIANDVSTCGVEAARNAWVVELHHPSGAQLSAVVLAHYAGGWQVFGSYA